MEGRAADAEVEGTLDAAGSGPCHRSPPGGAPGPRAGLWGTVPSRRRELLSVGTVREFWGWFCVFAFWG